MIKTASLLCLLCVFLTACVSEPVEHTAGRIEADSNNRLEYLISLPEGYDPQGEAVPLLLFLHGAGERGSDLKQVALHGPPKMIEQGYQFDAIVVSPQCPSNTWWTDHLDLLVALLDRIEQEHNIDRSRIYVTGLSMGGYGSFALAAKQNDRFAAVVPVCGGGSYFDALRLSRVPMWVFHGDRDEVVPLDESVRMVRFANERGGHHARLTVYPDTGHDSWTAAYGDPELWAWMFAQKK